MYHVVAILIVHRVTHKRSTVVREIINIQSKSNRTDEWETYFSFKFSSTPIVSTVQPTCIKNLSIFQSNSPYIIQKMGELVCVDYERCLSFFCFKWVFSCWIWRRILDQGSQYYQIPNIQTLNPDAFVQAINTEYSVSASYSTPTNLTNYQVKYIKGLYGHLQVFFS
jgi:hypothetical protein